MRTHYRCSRRRGPWLSLLRLPPLRSAAAAAPLAALLASYPRVGSLLVPCRRSNEFMATLMANPELVRNVALVGHIHHGKTGLMDMFVEQVRRARRLQVLRAQAGLQGWAS
jgi:hypothetical protein